MKHALLLVVVGCGSAAHPTHAPREQVLHYSVVTVGRPSGDGEVRIASDGTRREHFTFNDRGRGPDIVAGTDNVVGLTLTRELELDAHFGIPAADVLAMATLGAARVMHLDKDRGSITPGKRADLVLVDGDPTQDITQIRNTRVVVCRGIVFDPPELWQASGMKPRP